MPTLRIKVLSIDDDKLLQESLCYFLEKQGFDVITSDNGLSGLELAFKHLPDLIVCDINMPEVGGYQVLVRLRQNPSTAQIPVIFLTANSDPEYHNLALELGANAYLTKPLQPHNLLKTVSSLLHQDA